MRMVALAIALIVVAVGAVRPADAKSGCRGAPWGAIIAGPDGNVWFGELGPLEGPRALRACIGRITPAGAITEFPTAFARGFIEGGISDLASGADGNIWFSRSWPSRRVGRMTPSGGVTMFDVGAFADSVTPGPDGNVWFVMPSDVGVDVGVGSVSPSGTVRRLPLRGFAPIDLTSGPDGHLWATGVVFTGRMPPRIARITPSGEVTLFRAGRGALTDIIAGPDDDLWFIEQPWVDSEPPEYRIGRITTAGSVTMFSLGPRARGLVESLALGPDGNIWFTLPNQGGVGRMSPQGVVTVFRRGIVRGSAPDAITAGADGNLWFTQGDPPLSGRAVLARMTPTGTVTEFPPTPTIGPVRLPGLTAAVVSLHCPPVAAGACRGTLRVDGPSGGLLGARRYALDAGQHGEFAVPLRAAPRAGLRSGRAMRVAVRVIWRPGRAIGSVERGAVLRAPRPVLPAVTG